MKQQSGKPLEEYPDCPDCETDMPVIGHPGRMKLENDSEEYIEKYRCLRCELVFEVEEQ